MVATGLATTRQVTALVALVLAAAATVLAQPVANQREELQTEPGIYQLALPGSGRRYTLAVPEDYTASGPVPLVVSLHYGGEVTPWFGRGLLENVVEPALRELGALIVAPDNASRGWANSEAEQHVLELLEYVSGRYEVDRDRVLITGYSMGGMGTWYLAPRQRGWFTAAIPMAGRPGEDVGNAAWETPTYAIHSAADELIPLEPTRAAVDRLIERGAPVELVVVEGITHFQTARFMPHLQAAVPWLRRVWND